MPARRSHAETDRSHASRSSSLATTSDALKPMLATLSEPPLVNPSLVYEPKYDGIRTIAEVEPHKDKSHVRLWSRLGNEKTSQFPSIVRALEKLGKRLNVPLVLDGELVALDKNGAPTGFQKLQGRIHLTGRATSRASIAISRSRSSCSICCAMATTTCAACRSPSAARAWRRASKDTSSTLRLSEQIAGDGRAMHERAKAEGWEGLIAKSASRSISRAAAVPTG